ncbi:uncharacterized protein LOC118190631 [Stegodyphus dumicola]|uniref:uncharacterized protein LOC118190631 n=1 Tax=Stegodyphus dumicola TaxID=202533 RepID=UPI0015AFDD62|nr:uncharacterized protein LOC118190631 [Stegodyphus dumicola]
MDVNAPGITESVVFELSECYGLNISQIKSKGFSKSAPDFLDVAKVLQFLLEGRCNDHLVEIAFGRTRSIRHSLFFSDDPRRKSRLKALSWFGPLYNPDVQTRLFDYFFELYKSCMGDAAYTIPYIYEVWIPEGIVKSIALVENISQEEAQVLFDDAERHELLLSERNL